MTMMLKTKVKDKAPQRDTCCTLGFCAFCGGMVQQPPLMSAMGRKMSAFLKPLRLRRRQGGDAFTEGCSRK